MFRIKSILAAGLILAAATAGSAQTPVERTPLALKTNLLPDLVGTPNIGLEAALSKKISVEVDFAYAHWTIDNRYALQLIRGNMGAKYWFKLRKNRPLTGWNAGVYASFCGRYDVQWEEGWQGNGLWSSGLSAGYATPLSKRLNLEFVLAGGYVRAYEARHYHLPENGHLMWRQTRRNAGGFSLTKAQVNLVWSLYKNENR